MTIHVNWPFILSRFCPNVICCVDFKLGVFNIVSAHEMLVIRQKYTLYRLYPAHILGVSPGKLLRRRPNMDIIIIDDKFCEDSNKTGGISERRKSVK